MHNPIDSLLYVNIPADQVEKFFEGLDPSIPLPIRLSETEKKEEFKAEDMSPEMILAGMLTVFAYDRENIHIQYYRKIFNLLRPDIRKEMTQAAIIKTKNGDFDMAEEILLSLEGLNPQDGITKLNLALLMEERSQYCEMREFFEEAASFSKRAENFYLDLISSEPPLPDAFFNAAYFFIKRKNYAKSKSLLQTYLQIETSSSETAQVRKAKASKLLKTISEQALDDDLFQEAHRYIDLGEEEKAAESIKLFLRKNPKVWNAWFLLAWALRRMSRWEDAKSSFLQTIELLESSEVPDKAPLCDAYNELAICCMELKSFDEAEKYLVDALNFDTENIKIISNLGILALKRGRQEEAEAFFRTVLEINPEDKIALNVLGR
ncbi:MULTISPECIES: tetratricopeptide repeat protein [unclassified Treponema]|uniref:tetratricopeptide repeat protein n=1 Tax=unclassified Treponema TaxID=2638727 RepID=UPI0020A4D2AB|nr:MULTISPECIES: tetratricopeptide repeat protein [unclassified Treponema]UTC66762.1 tetratricopeptide repeat protein [Treponema sp. OMZ 789]UTC69494.1 tetratricopeptide repeat protein [Treponema sp. OMZ 790]UTC72208.1 tetratricopeptide repeat protein [Treponema sp. OMZ 791]